MRTIRILLLTAVLISLVSGCVSVNAPEKIEVEAGTGNHKWDRVASKYVSEYAGGGSERESHPNDDFEDD
jgi:hypothetical protein